MSLTVAIPTHPLFAPLVERAEQVCAERGFRLLRGSEHECARWIARHTAELALLTPLGYAEESYKTDYRIVEGPVLLLDGYTKAASLYLKPGAEELARCGSRAASDFVIRMGANILAEKFDIETMLTGFTDARSTEEAFAEYDVVLEYGLDEGQAIALDVSDEWTDYLNIPLPVAFWTCRPDEVPADVAELVASFARADVPDVEIVLEQPNGVASKSTTKSTANVASAASAEREGRIIWRWNADTEHAIQRTIEMLFYWQCTEAISATKLWQRDSAHPLHS